MASDDQEQINDLTRRIIKCAIDVHNEFGPGLLESVYRKALAIGLRAEGLKVDERRRVPLTYLGQSVDYLELDLLVNDTVLVEAKALGELAPVHSAQTITYLKLTGCPAGLLINFNVKRLEDGIRRLDRPDIFDEKRRKFKPLPRPR